MRVAELVLEVPVGARAAAERSIYAAGAQGLELRDRDHGVARGRVQLVWWAPAGLGRTIARAVGEPLGPSAKVSMRTVDATWLSRARPRAVGRGFVVVGPDDDLRSRRGRRAIALEGGLGFGDGCHATTALCVEAMERMPMPARVLDVGTGTGILAIAAAHLGATRVVATDVDPLARAAARVHFRRNRVRARLSSALPKGRFDLVVCNLYLEPLLALVPDLAARAPRVILSGFGVASTPRIAEALTRAGMRLESSRTRAGFACVVASGAPSTNRAANRRDLEV